MPGSHVLSESQRTARLGSNEQASLAQSHTMFVGFVLLQSKYLTETTKVKGGFTLTHSFREFQPIIVEHAWLRSPVHVAVSSMR